MTEYARWYKPVIILDGLVFLVAFTAIISGGENGEIIGSYGGLIGVVLFFIWFWHMKSKQTKSSYKIKYSNQPHQEKTPILCTRCGNENSSNSEGLCSNCLKEKKDKEREQREKDMKRSTKSANYYQLLNVAENATQDEIKKRWRELAKEVHPDSNNSSIAEDEFIIYRKAYEILSDPERRKVYNQQINLD